MSEVRLIDAIELVRYLCGACPSNQNGECIDKMCWKYEDRARIENAPTIEAEPVRHGRWIVKMLDIGGGDKIMMLQCSECSKNANMKFDYCPRCGARMDGGVYNGKI